MRFLWLGVFAALALAPAAAQAASAGSCVACVILVSLLERMALQQPALGNSPGQAAKLVCSNFDDATLRGTCDGLLGLVAGLIDGDYRAGRNPDYTCGKGALAGFKLCQGFESCQLYGSQWPPLDAGMMSPPQASPAAAPGLAHSELTPEQVRFVQTQFARLASWVPRLLGIQAGPAGADFGAQGDITKHLPVFDLDNDTFSGFPQLRGSDWRGADCDDQDATVYPGRRTSFGPAEVDHNCNGIAGKDAAGVPYEDRFCGSSGPRGVAALGDSATAHFRIPPSYLQAKTIDGQTYKGLLGLAMNELDWPHCSWSTGHAADPQTECPPSKLPFKSIYQRMAERNRCNHRDYANIGVNGARSTSMAPPGIATAFRRGKQDQPSIVFHALIGNDVCSSRATTDSMTPPAVFEEKVLATLNYLEANLPPNSTVIFVPLADGRVLYDVMARLVHPAGVLYSQFYDYLNCLRTSPCAGWMNSDASIRDATTGHARSLNNVYKKILRERRFRNFQMLEFEFDWQREVREWERLGNSAADLIEGTDGFHPSTTANQLMAERIWSWLEREHPQVIGAVNPYNTNIQALFGDQGGH